MSKPLFVVTFSNGSTDDLPSNSTVWLDLDRGNAGEWQALCTAEQVVDFRAGIGGNFDGEVENVEVWDGAAFGDGNCGCVESITPGILTVPSGFAHVVPAGWVAG
mgnify:CR=1 FL=1